MLQGKLCRFSLFILILLATIAIARYCSKESFGASTTAQTAGTGIMWTSAAITSASQTGTISTIVSVTNGLLYQLQGNFYTNSVNGVNISLNNCTLYSDAGGATAVSGNKILVAFGLVPTTTPSAYTTSYWFRPSGTGNLTFSVDYAIPFATQTGLINSQFTISITQLVIKQSVTGSTTYLTNNSTQGADFGAGTSTQYIGKAMKAISVTGFYNTTVSGTVNRSSGWGGIGNIIGVTDATTQLTSQADLINAISKWSPSQMYIFNDVDISSGKIIIFSYYTDVGFNVYSAVSGSVITLSGPSSNITNPYSSRNNTGGLSGQTFQITFP